MNKSKIEWTDYTWNPVTGCLHGCKYCYARRQAKRFCGDIRLNQKDPRISLDTPRRLYTVEEPFVSNSGRVISFPIGFSPTLHRYRMDWPGGVKHSAKVFVCSMADLFGDWVPDEWIQMVFEACKHYPHHQYLFLTKNPWRYVELAHSHKLPQDNNLWYGSTATNEEQMKMVADAFGALSSKTHTFVSLEPLMEDIAATGSWALACRSVDWVITGAMTGPGSEKYRPNREWVEDITRDANEFGVPVFMKDSLQTLMGNDFRQEFPSALAGQIGPKLTPKQEALRCGRCNFCGYEGEKKEMVALLYRKKRGQGAKALGYACQNCFSKLQEAIKPDRLCKIETVQEGKN